MGTPRTLGQIAWSWAVVASVLAIIIGGGFSFMTSGHPYIADVFFLIGAGLFLLKFFTWELPRQYVKKKLIFTIITIIIVIIVSGAICGNHYLNYTIKEKKLPPKIIVSLHELLHSSDGFLKLTITFNNDSDTSCIIKTVYMTTLRQDALAEFNKLINLQFENNYNNIFGRRLMSLGPVLLPKPGLPRKLDAHELWLYEIKNPFDPKKWIKMHEMKNIKKIPVGLSVEFIDYSGESAVNYIPFFAEIQISEDGKFDRIRSISRKKDLMKDRSIAVGGESIKVGKHPVGLNPPSNLLGK